MKKHRFKCHIHITDAGEEQPILQGSNTLQSETPKTQRRFAQPRYISEIQLSDVAIPRRATRTLLLAKMIDKKKSLEIKRLQNANKKRLYATDDFTFACKRNDFKRC